MIEVIHLEQSDRWDDIVKSFHCHDIYYHSGYTKAFKLHGDGEPVLFYFTDGEYRAICVMMKRDIALEPRLASANLTQGEHFDLITPYGYGGFLFDNDEVTEDSILCLKEELNLLLKSEKIVSAFFRFHPMLHNAAYHTKLMDVIDLGKTIALDLSSPEIIWQNITSKNRNVIRKAEKMGVEIKHGKGMHLLSKFKEIYDETMRHDDAEQYYFFPIEFYESIDKDLNGNYEIFYAECDGRIIASSIMIFAGDRMNYHLSGSILEYRKLAPSNLLLYKAALWGYEQGYKTLHLGGGVGSDEDNLYKFKAAFNRKSNYQFSIGKLIADENLYKEYAGLRSDHEFNPESKFFPLYRS